MTAPPVPVVEPVAQTQATALIAPEVQAVAPAAQVAAEQAPPSFDASYDNAPEMTGDEYDEYAAAPAYLDAGDYSPAPEVPEPKKSEAPETQANVIVEAALEIPPAAVIDDTSYVPQSVRKISYEQATPQDWPEIYVGLGVMGILQSTIANCQLVARNGNEFQFVVDDNNSTLYDPSHQQRLSDLLSNYFIERVHAKIQVGKITAETPALLAKRHQQERYDKAVVAIKTDPIVLQLIEHFGATLREETIQAI
jgi:DNA polymerase-3 subunit gamma/tau